MLRALIFDFDDVLVESAGIKTSAFVRLFAAEGPEVVQRIVAYHRAHGGVSRFEKFRTIYRDILRRPLDTETFQRFCDQFADLIVEAIIAAPWVEGAEAFLDAHRGRYRFFVVSGTPEEELRTIVQRRQMAHYFDGVYGSPTPKEILLRQVLARQHLQPTEVLFIGDAATDWLTAQTLGLPFLWRQGPQTPRLTGYTGPRITSLAELDAYLMPKTWANRLQILPAWQVERFARRHPDRVGWCYLGTDVAQRTRVARALSSREEIPIGEDLTRLAYELRDAFLNWIGEMGRYQPDPVSWWSSAVASKSPLQTDCFVLVCYAELVRRWLRDASVGPRLVVIEDPWLALLVRRHLQDHQAVACRSVGWGRCAWEATRWLLRVPSAVAVTVLWALKTLVVVRRAYRKVLTPDAADGPRAVWIYSWIEPRCFATSGRFTDPWTGRLEELLSAHGERVQRLTPLEIPSRLLPSLATLTSPIFITPRALTLGDIFRAISQVFWIRRLGRVATFRGWDYSLLLWREQLREWGQPQGAHYRMFYAVMRRIARRHRHLVKCLIYPFENQPWEKLLCLAWREQAPDVTLVGYQHSWVPPLLLPYALGATERETTPLPDRIVTSSPVNHRTLIAGGFPEAKLVNGGALRHEYLHAANGRWAAPNAVVSARPRPRVVMVTFPLHEAYCRWLLVDLLEELQTPLTVHGKEDPTRFILRFHPSLPLRRFFRQAVSLPPWMACSTQPTSEVLAEADALLFAGPTSTWWEAVLSGVPVVKYQPDLLDIDAGEGLPGLRVERCTRATLRATLCRVLQEDSPRRPPARWVVEELFGTVNEGVWKSVVSR